MDMLTPFFNSPFFTWVILPLLIVLSRIVDVTIGTMRIIYISRGMKILAPIFGFFEITIWLIVITQIMNNLTNPVYYIAYALGFSIGNYVGIFVEEKLAIGNVVVRIITQKDASELIAFLRKEGFGLTSIEATGATGKVKVIFTIVKRDILDELIGHIQEFNPKAFFSVEDVKMAREGIFPPPKELNRFSFTGLLRTRRKEK